MVGPFSLREEEGELGLKIAVRRVRLSTSEALLEVTSYQAISCDCVPLG